MKTFNECNGLMVDIAKYYGYMDEISKGMDE